MAAKRQPGTICTSFLVGSGSTTGKIAITAVAGSLDKTLTLTNAALTDNRTITFPDGSGTPAMTTALANMTFASLTPGYAAYGSAGSGGRNAPFINIGSWDAPMNITLASDHWVPIQVNLKNSGNVAFDVAAARLRVDTGATNATAAVGCLQLRQNLGHNVASSAILNASVNVSAAVTVGTGSLLGGYFSIEGSGQIIKAGSNDCTVLVAVNNNTNSSNTVDNVFVALQNGTGSTVSEIVLVDVTNGTATTGISIENSAGTLTTGLKFSNTVTTGISFTGTATTHIDFTSATITPEATRANSCIAIGDRLGAKTIAMTAGGVAKHLDPVQINLNVTGTTPGAVSTINGIYQLITHSTTAMTGELRLKCADWTISVTKNLQDAYVFQGELDFLTNAVAVGGEATALGLTVNAATAVTGNVWGGIIVVSGTGIPAATSAVLKLDSRDTATVTHGLYLEVASGATMTNGIYANVAGTMTSVIRINGSTNTTNLLQFDAQAGCLSADTAATPANTIAKIKIDMNGTPGYIPVMADY
jgi:hypothetical protein